MHVVICRSNPILPDPRVEKEAAALSTSGYSVRIVGWDRMTSFPGERLPIEEIAHDYWITRLPIRAPFGAGLMNLPNLLRWQVGLLDWLVRHRHEYALIHACDFDTILPALICKRLWNKKVIYDIFDFYADHLRRTPSLLKRWIRRTDLWAIGQADAVILADDARREQIRGSHPKRVEIIYNSPEDVYEQLQPGSRRREGNELRLAYIGLLQIERGLLELLEVLALHPEWKLDLAGFGGDQERILSVARQLPNVTWHGRVAYIRALELSASADVLIAMYDPSIPNHRLSSPNKLFEALMLGKPILVARYTHMDRLVEAEGCGMVLDYGDLPALEHALARLHQDRELREALGKKARRAYETTYQWSRMQARLLELYRQVCNPLAACDEQP